MSNKVWKPNPAFTCPHYLSWADLEKHTRKESCSNIYLPTFSQACRLWELSSLQGAIRSFLIFGIASELEAISGLIFPSPVFPWAALWEPPEIRSQLWFEKCWVS